jgi:hypothetical protein
MEHAHDVVERLTEYRNPAVAAAGKDQADFFERSVFLDGDDVGTRCHHFAYRPGAEGHYAAHHHQLVIVGHTYRRALPPYAAKVGGPRCGTGGKQQTQHSRPGAQDGNDAVGYGFGPRLGKPSRD